MNLLKNNKPTLGIIFILAALTAIQPLSTDMYLPSLLGIAETLNTDMAHVQITLSIFMFGFALGQIFYGPFADKYGRRPVLIVSLSIYMLGSLLCILANNIELLIFGRLLQALGGSGPMILGRTIVRDILKGDAAGKMLATMGFIMGLMPMIAPIIGGILHTNFGWRSNFYVFFGYAIFLILITLFILPETVPKKTTATLSPKTFLKIYNGLFANQTFRFFVTRISLTYGGIFTFISGSSFYLQTRFELSPQAFSYAFAFSVLGYLIGTLIGARTAMAFGAYKLIFYGAICQLIGGLSMFLLHYSGTFHAIQLVLPMMIYLIGSGLTMPQSLAGTMSDFPEKAGAASSLAGVVQVSTAAIIGTFVGVLIEDYIFIMPLTLMVIGAVNFMPCYLSRFKKL